MIVEKEMEHKLGQCIVHTVHEFVLIYQTTHSLVSLL